MTSPERDEDELFKQIVAGFGDPPEAEWPASGELLHEGAVDPPEVEDLPAWLEPDALPDEGHYVPPPPPKVPRLRPRTVLASLMVVLGLVILFAPRLVGLDESAIYLLIGLLLAGGGAGLLISWMRDAPPDDLDDGAVV
jgi:hypothetical protein